MKTLDIFGNRRKKEEKTIKFDEFMYGGGLWAPSNSEYLRKEVIKVNYEDDRYDYFINQDGEHLFLRKKK